MDEKKIITLYERNGVYSFQTYSNPSFGEIIDACLITICCLIINDSRNKKNPSKYRYDILDLVYNSLRATIEANKDRTFFSTWPSHIRKLRIDGFYKSKRTK